MNTKAKKELKEEFEDLRLFLIGVEFEGDGDALFLDWIDRVDQAITKARQELLSELYRAGRTSFAGGFKDDPQKVFDNLQEKYYQSLTKEK